MPTNTTVAAFAHVSNMEKLEHLPNSSVNELRLWADANKLPLNEEKKTCSVGRTYIESVTSLYIFFFFQEINDSLKNLLFYPFQFTDR